MERKNNFSHAATVFPVTNIQNSVEFYTKTLEFEKTFEWGEPTSYVVLKKGQISIHLTEKIDNYVPSKKHCALYIFVCDVDKIYQRCLKENVSIMNWPETRDYNMKDFDIIDPDGFIITFGKGQ